MLNTMTALKTAGLAGFAAIAAACVSEPAHAGGYWTLNPSACPDLVEDRIDRRITWSRADLREDRRDVRRVRCPARAYSYVPGPRERAARRAFHPDAVVLVGPGRTYLVRDTHGRDIDVRIVVR